MLLFDFTLNLFAYYIDEIGNTNQVLNWVRVKHLSFHLVELFVQLFLQVDRKQKRVVAQMEQYFYEFLLHIQWRQI